MEHDPLATYLEALARDDCYRVHRVLKTNPHETTEVVFFVGANDAALGPFVRKRISGEVPLGSAYGLLAEAQRTGHRFRHLPRIYDVHERDGDLVVVMEFVGGRTLRDVVYERDASVALAREVFPILCDGVIELHEGFAPPLIHRDLKPSNIVVSDGGLTIIDFGIARAFHEGAGADTTHFGTRSYAPPEQFGYGQTDVRSDVYALGMLLYYLVTERDPDARVATGGFADPDVPPMLRPVLQRACAFDPAARFSSVRALKAAFLAALGAQAALDAAPAAGLQVQGAASAVPHGGAMASSEGAGIPRPTMVQRVRAAFSSLRGTEAAGLVWDCMLLSAWLLFVGVALAMPFDPGEGYEQWPRWLLVFQYWFFAAPFFTGIACALLDVRVVARMFPRLRRYTLRWRLITSGVLVGAGVLAVGCTVAMASVLGLPR